MTDICSICGKEVLPDQGVYSITGDHWDCHEKEMIALRSTIDKFKPRAKRGEGKASLIVKDLINKAFQEYFQTDDNFDVTLYLNPPVWNQKRFDVQCFQAMVTSGDQQYSLGSWEGVTELSKHRRLKITPDGPTFELNPL